jgi:hypothetical protein
VEGIRHFIAQNSDVLPYALKWASDVMAIGPIHSPVNPVAEARGRPNLFLSVRRVNKKKVEIEKRSFDSSAKPVRNCTNLTRSVSSKDGTSIAFWYGE